MQSFIFIYSPADVQYIIQEETHKMSEMSCILFRKQEKKNWQHTWHPSQDDLSHKSRTRGHPAQQHPGEQDVITKLLVVLPHWAPLCVTVGNLFTLVRITSQVWQPVNPRNETWFESTSGTLQTPLRQSMHGQLIPKCACCCCSTVWCKLHK